MRHYKSLSAVERAFRSLKTVDLHVRPIHHREPDRVRAHIFLCMLAYHVEWHMRQDLAPLLFDDDDRAAAQQLRSSVVAPAQRSTAAQQKVHRRRTPDDLPVHSFQTLLHDCQQSRAAAGCGYPRVRHHHHAYRSAATRPGPAAGAAQAPGL